MKNLLISALVASSMLFVVGNVAAGDKKGPPANVSQPFSSVAFKKSGAVNLGDVVGTVVTASGQELVGLSTDEVKAMAKTAGGLLIRIKAKNNQTGQEELVVTTIRETENGGYTITFPDGSTQPIG